MEGYKFSTDILVRFAETDAQGIAHHASFVVWLEVARVAYLAEHAGGYLSIQAQGIEALTTAVEVRYHRAAYFDDRLRVWTRCVDIRGARFSYEYAVEREGELVADGHTLARDRRRVNAPARRVCPPGSRRRWLRQRVRRRRGVRHGVRRAGDERVHFRRRGLLSASAWASSPRVRPSARSGRTSTTCPRAARCRSSRRRCG